MTKNSARYMAYFLVVKKCNIELCGLRFDKAIATVYQLLLELLHIQNSKNQIFIDITCLNMQNKC